MNIGILILILLFGLMLYYMLFCVPSSDLVFTSSSEAEVIKMKGYLDANGIRTYIKNRDVRRFHSPGVQCSDAVNPSLHVVEPDDYKNALKLIRSLKNT